jgi:simple sugar transport system ATP-binding protein
MARELRTVPTLLVASQPTRGVDVGASTAIHARIEEVALAGAAVLVASAELGELLRLCDSIVVLYRGRIVHRTAVADTDPETLGRWMLGGSEVIS